MSAAKAFAHAILVDRVVKRAGGYVIGPRGLEKPNPKITLQDGAAYYLGASSSPQFVILTDVSDKMVKYKSYPFDGSELRMERWIAADLLDKGTRTALKTYGSHMDPDLKHAMESLPRGGKGRKENMHDYKRVTVTVEPTEAYQGKDMWYAAEEYGGVAGGVDDDESVTQYHITTNNKSVEQLRNDRRFKVIKVQNA